MSQSHNEDASAMSSTLQTVHEISDKNQIYARVAAMCSTKTISRVPRNKRRKMEKTHEKNRQRQTRKRLKKRERK